MAGRYVGFGKKLFDLAKGESKSKVSTTIVGVTPSKNLTKRRKDFEDLVKTTDKYTKNLTKEGQISVKKTVAPAAKKISGIHNKYEKRSRKAGGGMMRSRMGLKKGSFPDHSGDGKITKKDILMAKGVIPKPKNKKSKKKVI